jgi:hypothetical protein
MATGLGGTNRLILHIIKEIVMFSSRTGKRRTKSRTYLHLEPLETRALPSSAAGLGALDTVNTTNWSGYAAQTNLTLPASNAVTAVSGSWTVPAVSGSGAYSSVWVGIDGYTSSTVEQIGTEQDVSNHGKASYYAWWEMYPNYSYRITGFPISPGDSISASVTYAGGPFTLQLADNTTRQSFTTSQSLPSGYTAQLSSADWIVEAPSSIFGVLPLANFGQANLSVASATINGVTGPIDGSSWQNTSIDMVSGATTIAHTSALTDSATTPATSSFNVAYTGSSGGGGGGGHHHHGPITVVSPLPNPGQNYIQASTAVAAGTLLVPAVNAAILPAIPPLAASASQGVPRDHWGLLPGKTASFEQEEAPASPDASKPEDSVLPDGDSMDWLDASTVLPVQSPAALRSPENADTAFSTLPAWEDTSLSFLEEGDSRIDCLSPTGLAALLLGAYLAHPKEHREKAPGGRSLS